MEKEKYERDSESGGEIEVKVESVVTEKKKKEKKV